MLAVAKDIRPKLVIERVPILGYFPEYFDSTIPGSLYGSDAQMRCQDTCYHKFVLELETIDTIVPEEITDISEIDWTDTFSVHYQMIQAAYSVFDDIYSFSGTAPERFE